MDQTWSDEQLRAFFDEQLPAEQMSQLEDELRQSETLRNRLAALARSRDDGVHSVGEIWRRHKLSCPKREQLGSYLLGALSPDEAGYVEFHLQTVGCRYCRANLGDLEEQAAAVQGTQQRRRRYFESSAGLLRSQADEESP